MFYYAPVRRDGAINVAFVRPSVRLSVRRVHSDYFENPKAQRAQFGMKVPHLRCDLCSSFKVKRSNIKVTRPINAHTHRAPYLPNGKVYELQTRYTDGGRRPASATGA